jgi:hypothetical protein
MGAIFGNDSLIKQLFSPCIFHCVVQNFDYSILLSKNTIGSPNISRGLP